MTDLNLSLKQRLSGRSIYLIGMMGSGKTSTGRPLAKRLGYGFVDADAVIEQAAGCSIPAIFERDGEAGFRAIERQVLNTISQRHSLVVATGGGVVTTPENWGQLHSGIVVWLDVDRGQLLARLRADSTMRPLLQQRTQGGVGQQAREQLAQIHIKPNHDADVQFSPVFWRGHDPTACGHH